jgi:hypothetical protein
MALAAGRLATTFLAAGLARVLLAGTITLPTVRTAVFDSGFGAALAVALFRTGVLPAALF